MSPCPRWSWLARLLTTRGRPKRRTHHCRIPSRREQQQQQQQHPAHLLWRGARHQQQRLQGPRMLDSWVTSDLLWKIAKTKMWRPRLCWWIPDMHNCQGSRRRDMISAFLLRTNPRNSPLKTYLQPRNSWLEWYSQSIPCLREVFFPPYKSPYKTYLQHRGSW